MISKEYDKTHLEHVMSTKKLSKLAVEFILTRDISELSTLSLASVASHLKVDSPLLAQEFLKDQKMSMDGFILREKMHRAALILETATLPLIDQLSLSLGFSNTEAFILEFEGYLAVDPAKYWALKHIENVD